MCNESDPDARPAPPDGPSSGLPPWGSEDDAARFSRLLLKARALPKSPGVYLMKDAKGVVLYVGKAGNLPDRVASYFVPSADPGPNKLAMLELVHDFEHLECDGEWEALLTENRLIKDIRPRFNVRLVDDKTFPYLAVTLRDDFPRVFITRNPADPDFRGARVIGPFVSVGALRHAIKLLQRVFKFRTCSLEILENDPKNRFFRPCLLHSIGQCTAPCAARIGKDAYRDDVDRFLRFLDSKRSVALRELRDQMLAASAAQEFEKAATLRDQIRAIERLSERGTRNDRWQPETESFYVDPKKGLRSLQKALGLDNPIRCLEAIDIAHLQGDETVGSKVCFVDGRPFKNAYRRYRVRAVTDGSAQGGDDYASIREVISRRYREAGAGQELFPDVILVDGGLGQLHAALEAFAAMDIKPPLVISLAKKEELIYVQDRAAPLRLSREHLGLKLCQQARDEAHRFAQHYHHILRRKKTLSDNPPSPRAGRE